MGNSTGDQTGDVDNINKNIYHGQLYRSQNIFTDIILKPTLIPVLGSYITILMIMIRANTEIFFNTI